MGSKTGIIGRTIKEVRPMTQQEMTREDWGRPTTCIVLDDGTTLYPSRDDEGNGPGAMFGTGPDRKQFVLR